MCTQVNQGTAYKARAARAKAATDPSPAESLAPAPVEKDGVAGPVGVVPVPLPGFPPVGAAPPGTWVDEQTVTYTVSGSPTAPPSVVVGSAGASVSVAEGSVGASVEDGSVGASVEDGSTGAAEEDSSPPVPSSAGVGAEGLGGVQGLDLVSGLAGGAHAADGGGGDLLLVVGGALAGELLLAAGGGAGGGVEDALDL
ncbi:hypothetical protein ACLOAV_003398 [Pseudogymnoascus australis]